MTSMEFWTAFNVELFSEIVVMVMTSFVIGYAVGYKLYAFRLIASSAT